MCRLWWWCRGGAGGRCQLFCIFKELPTYDVASLKTLKKYPDARQTPLIKSTPTQVRLQLDFDFVTPAFCSPDDVGVIR